MSIGFNIATSSKICLLYRCLLLVPLIFTAGKINAQAVIYGVVTSYDKQKLPHASVVLLQQNSDKIIAFTKTDVDGAYSISHQGNGDSVTIKVSCFDFSSQQITITNQSQEVNFSLLEEATVLPDAVIRPSSVWRNRDTVSYSVLRFAVGSDRTIADILKKMPGIEVSETGRISYNGEAINRFYVEGMDLMGGQYNVISNNLGYKNVETVQVLENHEPVKALQEQSISDKAAINLVLREDAKAKWLASGKLGFGFSPLLWENELTIMRFARKTQGSYVYKNSNTGNDITQDLIGHYGIIGTTGTTDVLSVTVQQPSIQESKRYLFNNAHMLTANQLLNLNNDYTLRFNADYLNDRHKLSSSNKTIYYLPNSEEVVVDEVNHAVINKNQAKLALNLTGNHSKYYLNNTLKVQGDWSNTLANVGSYGQRLENPSLNITNNFSWLKHIRKLRIDIQSNNKYIHLPQSLAVRSGLYPELLNDSIPYEYTRQDATLNNFSSDTYAGLTLTKGRFRNSVKAGTMVSWQELTSSLSIADRLADGAYQNSTTFLQTKYYINPHFEYSGKRITGSIQLPVGYMVQHSNDKLNRIKNGKNNIYLNPTFYIRYNINQVWSAGFHAGYNNSFDDIQSIYTGYMLLNYRSILRNSGDFSVTDVQSYRFQFSYRDPVKLANAYISASYSRSHFDKLFSQDFDGVLSIRRAIPYSHYSDNKSVNLFASKGFRKYITKLTLTGGYSISYSSLLQNAEIFDYERKALHANFSLVGDFSRLVNYSYSIQYLNTKPYLKGGSSSLAYSSISKVGQKIQLNVLPHKKLLLSASMSHEKSYSDNDYPSTFFMDLMLQYKLKRFDFSVSWNNIFDAKDYVIAYYGEFMSSVNSYELRPTNLVLSARFSL